MENYFLCVVQMKLWGAKKIICFLLTIFAFVNNFYMIAYATNVSINEKVGRASVYYANGDIMDHEGIIYHADGSVTYTDGTFKDVNGAFHYPDGSIKMPNGTIYFSSGVIQYSSGLQVNADGERISSEEKKYDEYDGIWDYEPATNNWKFKIIDENGYVLRIYYNCWIYKKNAKGIGSWYAVDDEGNMITGWVKHNGEYYYLSPKSSSKGELITGETIIAGKTYEFDEKTGALLKGDKPTRNLSVIGPKNYVSREDGYWKRGKNGKRYFMVYKSVPGVLKVSEPASGWIMIDGYYYYLDKEGLPETGLKMYEGKYYYLEQDGKMVEGKEIHIGGVTYVFDKATGACVTMY